MLILHVLVLKIGEETFRAEATSNTPDKTPSLQRQKTAWVVYCHNCKKQQSENRCETPNKPTKCTIRLRKQ